MSTLSKKYDKIFEKFFSSYSPIDDNRSDFEKFKSLLRFISSLRKRGFLDNEQFESLVMHATSILIENHLENSLAKTFKILEEEPKLDREKKSWWQGSYY